MTETLDSLVAYWEAEGNLAEGTDALGLLASSDHATIQALAAHPHRFMLDLAVAAIGHHGVSVTSRHFESKLLLLIEHRSPALERYLRAFVEAWYFRNLPEQAAVLCSLPAFEGSNLPALHYHRCVTALKTGDFDAACAALVDYPRDENAWTQATYWTLCWLCQDWDRLMEAAGLAVPERENAQVQDAYRQALVRATAPARPDTASVTPIWCVNLDRDANRFATVSASFKRIGYGIDRHPAVLGSALPRLMVERVSVPRLKDFAIGCGLSHIAVWERLIASEHAHALIVEDDGAPNYRFDLDAIVAGLPEGWDVCFANDRMAPGWDQETGIRPEALRAADEILADLPPDTSAIGTDGYLISRAGATKLLAQAAEAGHVGHIDWQMFVSGYIGEEIEGEGTVRTTIRRMRRKVAGAAKLSLYALRLPLIVHMPLGYYTR